MSADREVIIEIDSDKMPRPTGYRVLIKPLPPIDKSEGGIDLSATIRTQEILSQIGLVIELGPLAYDIKNNPEKYGDSAWCKEGDWVLYGKHVGVRFRTTDKNEWLILNDDSVLAVVPDPRMIDRINYGI